MTLVPKKKVSAFCNCVANIIYFSILVILCCAVDTAFMMRSINPATLFPAVFDIGSCFLLLPCIIIAMGIHLADVSFIVINEKEELLTIHYKSSLSLFAKSHTKVIPFSELEYCCEQMPHWVVILNYLLFFIPMFRISLFSKSQLKFVFRQSCGWSKEQYSEIISALQTIKEPRDAKDLLF